MKNEKIHLDIEMTEEQLGILIRCLEIVFRMEMHQPESVVFELTNAVYPLNSKFESDKELAHAVEKFYIRREIAENLMKTTLDLIYGTNQEKLPEETHDITDMWRVLRHTQYNLCPNPNTKDWDVRSIKPIKMGNIPLMKVGIIK